MVRLAVKGLDADLIKKFKAAATLDFGKKRNKQALALTEALEMWMGIVGRHFRAAYKKPRGPQRG